MSLALYLFSLLPIPVLVSIAVAIYRRKQHVVYPIFCAYICFQAIALAVEFSCKPFSYKAFFYTYWSASLLNLVFQLLLLRDIFRRVLKQYSTLDTVRRTGYELVLSFLWCSAVALTVGMSPPVGIFRKIARVELLVSFTAVGMFVFVIITSFILGIRWKSAVCGIAAGLGVLGTVDLFVFLVISRVPLLSRNVLIASWMETVAFDAAVAIFAFYFLPHRIEFEVPAAAKPELLEWADSMRGSIPR